MKKMISGLVLSLVLVASLAMSAFAGGDVTKSFTLTRESKVNGQTLKEGEYTIKFADDKEGELVVLKGKKEVAKASYRFKEMKSIPETVVVYSQNDDGSLTVKRLEFKGMKSALVLEE